MPVSRKRVFTKDKKTGKVKVVRTYGKPKKSVKKVKTNKPTSTAYKPTSSTPSRGYDTRQTPTQKRVQTTNSTTQSRKGKSTASNTQSTAIKYGTLGHSKAESWKDYNAKRNQLKRKIDAEKKKQGKSEVHTVKRGGSQFAKATGSRTYGKDTKGNLKSYKSETDYYKKNKDVRDSKLRETALKYEKESWSKGVTDALKESLGMESTSDATKRRLGLTETRRTSGGSRKGRPDSKGRINKGYSYTDKPLGDKQTKAYDERIEKVKSSDSYQGGKTLGEMAAFIAPGLAEEKVAGAIIKGGSKVLKGAKLGKNIKNVGKVEDVTKFGKVTKDSGRIAGVTKSANGKALKGITRTLDKNGNKVVKGTKAVSEFKARRIADLSTTMPIDMAQASGNAHETQKQIDKQKKQINKTRDTLLQTQYQTESARKDTENTIRKMVKEGRLTAEQGDKALSKLNKDVREYNVTLGKAITEANKQKSDIESQSSGFGANFIANVVLGQVIAGGMNVRGVGKFAKGEGKATLKFTKEQANVIKKMGKSGVDKALASLEKAGKTSGWDIKKLSTQIMDGAKVPETKVAAKVPETKVAAKSSTVKRPNAELEKAIANKETTLVPKGKENISYKVENALSKLEKDKKLTKEQLASVKEEMQRSGIMQRVDAVSPSNQARGQRIVKKGTLKESAELNNVPLNAKKESAKALENIKPTLVPPKNVSEAVTNGKQALKQAKKEVGYNFDVMKDIKPDNIVKRTSVKMREMFTSSVAKLEDNINHITDKAKRDAMQGHLIEFVQSESKIAQQLSKEGVQTNLSGTKAVGRSLQNIWTDVGSLEKTLKGAKHPELNKTYEQIKKDVDDYLFHSDNISRAKYGKGYIDANDTEITKQMSQKRVKELKNEYENTDLEWLFHDTKDRMSFAHEVQKYSDNLLEMMVDGNLVSKEFAKELRTKYKHHIPAYRVMEREGNGVKTANIESIRTSHGGSGQLYQPKDQQIIQTETVIKNAEANKFLNKYAEAMGIKPKTFDEGLDVSDMFNDPTGGIRIAPNGNEYDVVFFKDGKQVHMSVGKAEGREIEKTLAGHFSIKDLPAAARIPLQALTIPTKVLKNLATNYSPTFPIKNGLRDTQTALINARNLEGFVKELPGAYKEMWNGTFGKGKADEWYNLYAASGAKNSSLVYRSADDFVTSAGNPYKLDISGKRTLHDLNIVDKFNETIENGTRFAEFKASLKKDLNGKPLSEATDDMIARARLRAAEVSTNFGRSGDVGRIINQFVPFFNAGVQGLSREMRLVTDALKNRNGKLIATEMAKLGLKATAFGIAPSAINEVLANFDPETRDEYNEIPANIRLTNFCFKVGDTWVRIPRGRLNSVLGMMGNAYIANKESLAEYTGKDLWEAFTTQAAPANPLENNIFMPLVNSMFLNKTWYGSNIVSQYELDKVDEGEMEAKDVYDENSSWYAKKMGELFGWMPKKTDAMLDQYFASWAKIGHALTAESLTGKNASNLPVLQDFLVDVVGKNNLQTNFYKKLDPLYEKYADDVKKLHAKDEGMTDEKLEKTKLSYGDIFDLHDKGKMSDKDFEKAQRLFNYRNRLYDINGAIVDVYKDKSLDRKQKLSKIDLLQKLRNNYLREEQAGDELSDGYKGEDASNLAKIMGAKYVVNNLYEGKGTKNDQYYAMKQYVKAAAKTSSYKEALKIYTDTLKIAGEGYTLKIKYDKKNERGYDGLSDAGIIALASNKANKKLCEAYGVDYKSVQKYRNAIRNGSVKKKDLIMFAQKSANVMHDIGSQDNAKYYALAEMGADGNLAKLVTDKTYGNTWSDENYKAQRYYKLKAFTSLVNLGYTPKQIGKWVKGAKELSEPTDKGYKFVTAEGTTKYMEKHLSKKSKVEKANIWAALNTSFGEMQNNPYGEVRVISPKAKGKQLKETSRNMPTVTKAGVRYSVEPLSEKEQAKAFMYDNLAKAEAMHKAEKVLKDPKSTAEQKKSVVDNAIKEISGTNGHLSRMNRARFKPAGKAPEVESGVENSSGYSKYRKYGHGSGGSGSKKSSSSGTSTSSLKYGKLKYYTWEEWNKWLKENVPDVTYKWKKSPLTNSWRKRARKYTRNTK